MVVVGANGASICLCMIVRDESAVIARCIESARAIVDSWLICDTGSVDGTPELIADLLADLPGELRPTEWRDFGTNRTELMRLARGRADYLLLLDADITIRRKTALPPLTSDAYLLRDVGDIDYAVPRLVSGRLEWRFEGSTHEYLTSDQPYTQDELPALVVEHHADGGSRASKLERDAVLLKRDLERDPSDARAVFYLAQTCRDLGDHGRAIELYRRRVELGGWDEEVFYAAYQVGALLALSDDSEAVPALLDAWQRRPGRAEPLYELARFARCRGWHQAAYTFARRATEISYPADDLLFVERHVYTWGLRFELAIAAHWVGEFEQALELNDALLAGNGLPPEIEQSVVGNRRLCAEELGVEQISAPAARTLDELAPGVAIAEIRLDVDPAWPQFNPSIAAGDGGFRMIVRTSNYLLENGIYEFLTEDAVVRTLNYMVELDGDLNLTSVAPMVDQSAGPHRFPSRVEGYEDCRLVRTPDGWFATATVRDRNPDERCEVAVLELSGNDIATMYLLPAASGERHEKNWMPFMMDGALHLLYSCSPTIVLRCDPRSGRHEQVSERPGPPAATYLRGGSQGVELDDGFLFVVHIASGFGADRRYSHRLVLLDRRFEISALSPPFSFGGDPIEFCAGMARRNGELVMSFGAGDRKAALAVVGLDDALNLLEPA